MLIDETQNPTFEIAWEGESVYADSTEVVKRGGTALPRIQIGKPTWWNDERIMGVSWIPPIGGNRYGLARFPFSINSLGRQSVQKVEVRLQLMSRWTGDAPWAFDMIPSNENETQEFERTLGFSPTFKMVGAEASGVKYERAIKVKIAAAVITTTNLMTDCPTWTFTAHPNRPIHGNHSVYVVVEIPSTTHGIRVIIHIDMMLYDALFGPLRALLPQENAGERTFTLE